MNSVELSFMYLQATTWTALALLTAVVAQTPAAADNADTEAAAGELFALTGAGYNGGMTAINNSIATRLGTAARREFGGDLAACASDGSETPEQPLTADGGGRVLELEGGVTGTLLDALKHEQKEVRDTAAFALAMIGPALKPVLTDSAPFDGPDDFRDGWGRHLATRTFCTSGPAADYLAVTPEGVFPPDGTGGSDRPDIDALLLAWLMADRNRRWPDDMFVTAYRQLGTSAVLAAPKLIEIVADDSRDPGLRIEAAKSLAVIGPASLSTSAMLQDLLAIPDEDVRAYAREALIARGDTAALPILLDRLENGNDVDGWSGRFCAFGERAAPALPILAQQMLGFHENNSRPDHRIAAAAELGCLGRPRSIPFLTKALGGNDWRLQGVAARSLGEIGSAEFGALDALQDVALNHWSRVVRAEARQAINVISRIETPTDRSPQNPRRDWLCQGECVHGLPACFESTVSDTYVRLASGRPEWIHWLPADPVPPPAGLPAGVAADAQAVYAVEDGWLVGGRSQGSGLRHVTVSGSVTPLDERLENVATIVYTRLGLAALGVYRGARGNAGVVVSLDRVAGRWVAEPALVLPALPLAHGFAKDGTLLVAVQAGVVAVQDDRTVRPLRCGWEH